VRNTFQLLLLYTASKKSDFIRTGGCLFQRRATGGSDLNRNALLLRVDFMLRHNSQVRIEMLINELAYRLTCVIGRCRYEPHTMETCSYKQVLKQFLGCIKLKNPTYATSVCVKISTVLFSELKNLSHTHVTKNNASQASFVSAAQH
jgi:hypothetical protein